MENQSAAIRLFGKNCKLLLVSEAHTLWRGVLSLKPVPCIKVERSDLGSLAFCRPLKSSLDLYSTLQSHSCDLSLLKCIRNLTHNVLTES